MRKMGKWLIASAIMVMMVISLSGCMGVSTTLTFDSLNEKVDVENVIGWSSDVYGLGSDFTLDGKSYSAAMEQGWDEIGWIWWGSYSQLNRLLTYSNNGQEFTIGRMGIEDVYDDNERLIKNDGVIDILFNVEIDSGFTPKNLWDMNAGDIQSNKKAAAAYAQWQNASVSEKQAIEDQWAPDYILTVNFAAPVTCKIGSEYVTTNGKTATVNIGKMMQDDGGTVILYSSNGDLSYNPTHTNTELLGRESLWFEMKDVASGDQSNTPTQSVEIKQSVLDLFTDVASGAWYVDAVQYAYDNGIMGGYGNGKFGPNDFVTFSQLAQICYNAGYQDGDYYEDLGIDHWSADAVEWCLFRGLFIESDLKTDGKIDNAILDTGMTREQAIYTLTRFAYYMLEEAAGQSFTPPDVMDIDDRYRDTIMLAYQYGLTSGFDSVGTFSPKSSMTRAQVGQMFMNMGW